MMLLIRTLFGVFGVMRCVYVVKEKKKKKVHILYIIVAPLCTTFLTRVDIKAHLSEK